MRRVLFAAGLGLSALLTACSPKAGPTVAEKGDAPSAAGAAAPPATPATANVPGPGAAAAAAVACADYRADPEPGDMVMIYHAVSGLAPPLDKWAETILGKFDRQADPEGAWKQANAQIKAQYAAVAPVRCITLRTSANVRAYDPTRGGLVLGALGPDTYYPFREFGEEVRLKLRNAEAASIWTLPADRAEGLMRGGSNLSGANLVIRLRIVSARPSSGDGLIEGEVQSYDIEAPGGAKLATIAVAGGR